MFLLLAASISVVANAKLKHFRCVYKKKSKLRNFCFASFTTLLPVAFVNVVVVLFSVAVAFREKF